LSVSARPSAGSHADLQSHADLSALDLAERQDWLDPAIRLDLALIGELARRVEHGVVQSWVTHTAGLTLPVRMKAL
jgi:hypothetical protein